MELFYLKDQEGLDILPQCTNLDQYKGMVSFTQTLIVKQMREITKNKTTFEIYII